MLRRMYVPDWQPGHDKNGLSRCRHIRRNTLANTLVDATDTRTHAIRQHMDTRTTSIHGHTHCVNTWTHARAHLASDHISPEWSLSMYPTHRNIHAPTCTNFFTNKHASVPFGRSMHRSSGLSTPLQCPVALSCFSHLSAGAAEEEECAVEKTHQQSDHPGLVFLIPCTSSFVSSHQGIKLISSHSAQFCDAVYAQRGTRCLCGTTDCWICTLKGGL